MYRYTISTRMAHGKKSGNRSSAGDFHPYLRRTPFQAGNTEGSHCPKTGQTVSTSEAAKQLLESARDDRLELANLLTEPTDSLLNIRGKAEAHMPLTQAEWALVAYYCAKGAQSFMSTEQGQLSYDSLAEILEAFLAVYAIARRRKKLSLDFLYLMTLPEDKQVAAKEPDDVNSDDLRRVVTRTIQMLRDPAQKRRRPLLAVRNLYTLLDQKRSRISKS